MSLSQFHPTIRTWFSERLGEPTPPQRLGWPEIASGRHTLIAAPTGSGKTLSAFLIAIDALLREGESLPDETRVLYVSPLKALGNDISKNLEQPLAELAARDASFARVRVLVRSGDTTAKDRAAMTRRPPHILVTTPESAYLLLTSDRGRDMLRTVRTVIVDEIHAVCGDKRGSHLALSLERLEHLAGPVQRIGLSATQKPIEAVARFLVGPERTCATIDAGHLRELDLDVEIPASPLEAVCSHETWGEIYEHMAESIRAHRTTIVFVNTRKMAERVSAQLTKLIGEDEVTCHHGSLSKERRLAAEKRLKEGTLRALVATASLELGIDIGEVDLVIQCGSARSIATFLQRVGRAGHGVGRIPKGRIYPLTRDELIESLALLEAVRTGQLDRIPQPVGPLDILAQQIVASCVPEPWDEDELFALVRRSAPYAELTRDEFDQVVGLHTQGRLSLLHRDGVNRRLRATRRARIVALTSGGAIPDNADYRVVVEPDETFVGTVHEDFAIESNAGDIFQLGNASWRIVRVDRGLVRVADARGAPPTLPFWIAEAPGRTRELADVVSAIRDRAASPEQMAAELGVSIDVARSAAEYVEEGTRALGVVPTTRRVVLERFFDEAGGMQLVVHAPFGSRITKAWGLALRKRFCRHFGFELQAAANEEAIVISLGVQHSFALEEVFRYLHPNTARDVLIQALLDRPIFQTRWRWNVSRAFLLPRWDRGRRLPAPIARMRAEDLLVQAFPDVLACPENLPAGSTDVPMDHPMVRQTVEDCLTEALDVDGYLHVIRGIHDGTIETHAIDTPSPSAFAAGILNAQPYGFLDDAPLEERRTQAVVNRRSLRPIDADEIGALDPAAVARVREEAWPDARSAEEVHEALLWMGFVEEHEAPSWRDWLHDLHDGARVARDGDRWYAVEVDRDPVALWRGRMEALGPVVSEDLALLALEREGRVMRVRLDGREAWCDRRLLARIQRYTLDALRREIEPVSAADFLEFLGDWQYLRAPLEGPHGVARVLDRLSGFEAPAAAWEARILPTRVRNYRREWLDQLTLTGEFAWGRFWGTGAGPLRTVPVAFARRADLDAWRALAPLDRRSELSSYAQAIADTLDARGAMFQGDLMRASRLLPEHFEGGLAEAIAAGVVTSDSFRGVRQLLVPASRRRQRVVSEGRWSAFAEAGAPADDSLEFVARRLLDRWGVIFRRLLDRERMPVPWRDLARTYRTLEWRGEIRGGRFVNGFTGEQFALPEAVSALRRSRREGRRPEALVSAADPLNLRGILTPDRRIAANVRAEVPLV